MTLLSICIPTYNRLRYLQELLGDLLPQVEALPAGLVEVCISDNASTDDTSHYLTGLKSSGVRYWTNEKNIGGDKNFLLCIKKAQGEYVWLLGDDDLVAKDAVKRVIDALEAHKPGLLISSNVPADSSISVTDCAFESYAQLLSPRGVVFPLAHTLISANVFRREMFDMDFAASHLYLSYAHMFGMMRNLPGKRVCLLPAFVSTRPVRAAFAKFPAFLCEKQAIYILWLVKKFGLGFRYSLFALRLAVNLPMEYASRLKNWLKSV